MSRRSLYRPGRTHNSLYGPKTDTTIKHWVLDWSPRLTVHDEETDPALQRTNNEFKVKMWVKLRDEEYKPVEDGIENETIDLVDLMKDTANELAIKDSQERAVQPPLSGGGSILPSSTTPGSAAPSPTITELPNDSSANENDLQAGSEKPKELQPVEPKHEQPTPEQPTPEEPTPEEPASEEPKPEEPKPEEPKPEQPTPEQPKPEDPTIGNPTNGEPINTNGEPTNTNGGTTTEETNDENKSAMDVD